MSSLRAYRLDPQLSTTLVIFRWNQRESGEFLVSPPTELTDRPRRPCENVLVPTSYSPYRTDTLSVERDGPVTVVTITRPERRNALDSLCADQLRQAFLEFDRDESQSV